MDTAHPAPNNEPTTINSAMDLSTINHQPSTSQPGLPPSAPDAALCGNEPAADPTLDTTHPAPNNQPSPHNLTPLPGESVRAFEAFCAYLELGPRRRYVAAARKVGASLRTIKYWADRFDWRGRLQTHAARAAVQFVQTREAEFVEAAARDKALRERQSLLAEAILDLTERYFERVEDVDLEHVRLPDVCRALEFASRLLGQARKAEGAGPDHGLRDQLAALLDQAFRESPKPVSP